MGDGHSYPPGSLAALADLLAPKPNNAPTVRGTRRPAQQVAKRPDAPQEEHPPPSSRNIWTQAEAEVATNPIDINDPRATPEYTIRYKNYRSTGDTCGPFKRDEAASAMHDEIVVRVCLPGVKRMPEIRLDVRRTDLTLFTPLHKLHLQLPEPVDPDKGSAHWDAEKAELAVFLSPFTTLTTNDLVEMMARCT